MGLTKRQRYTKEYWQRDDVKRRKAEQNFEKYHTDPRFLARQKEVTQKYYDENRDKIIKHQTALNNKNTESRKEYARKYYLKHKEELKKRQKKYYSENTEQYKAYQKK